LSMSEKQKHKDKKRKENGDDEREGKKAKHKKHEDISDGEKKAKADKKDKKEKDKEKKKEKKQDKARSAAPAETAGDKRQAPESSPEAAAKAEPAKPVPIALNISLKEPPEKKLKAWQDDELEVESSDEGKEASTLETLSKVATSSLGGQGSAAAGGAETTATTEEPDSLDAFMADLSKKKTQLDMLAQGEGMGVMDASRVKSITLEEITALTTGKANDKATASSSSTAKPKQDAKAEDVPAAEGAAEGAGKAPAAAAAEGAAAQEDSEDDAFHAAFMAQMKKLRDGVPAKQEGGDDDSGSVTGEEWDDERKEKEKSKQEQREKKWREQDESAAAAGDRAEGDDEEDDDEEDDEGDAPDGKEVPAAGAASSSTAEATQPVATGQGGEEPAAAGEGIDKKVLTKKEKRRLRREAKMKEKAEKEAAKKEKPKPPPGMADEERLESDPDASEDSSEEKEPESYFELKMRFTTKKTLPQVDHTRIDYKAFRKNIYVQVKEITAMKDHEVDAFRRTNGEIRVRGKNCPRPIKSFLQCGLPEKILKIIEKRDYDKPFPIQMQAIPVLMCGRDMIGVAQTGSGKTLAYLLPMIRHCLDQPKIADGDGPIGFIVAPTRELALQISRECNVYCKAVNMISVCAYGGGPMGEQLSALKKGCEIMIGTPGRLIDVLTTSNGKITNLRRVTFLVLDEADRMFDMGFEPQIGMFLQATRPDKQVALLSATLPTHVEALARTVLKKPLEIIVGERNTAATNVTQFVEVLEESQKFYRLLQLLGEWHEHGSVIIFVHQQKDVDEMFTELLKFGYPALALHGGQDQQDRDFTLQDFKDGVANILVATSVAARGLDVKKVILVVNFKVPEHLEDYIHRIGRTGRAGKPGFAYTFIQPDEGDKAQDMVDALRQADQEIPEKLKRLTEEFQAKVNRGEAKKRRRWGGYNTKGFKFDNTEKSRQQKDRSKAKRDANIGSDNEADQEEEFRDPWNEDKPLSAKAAGKGKDKGKEKREEQEQTPASSSTSKFEGGALTTMQRAQQVAQKLHEEEAAKHKDPAPAAAAAAAVPGVSAAAAATVVGNPGGASSSSSMPPPAAPKFSAAAPKAAPSVKSVQEIDEQAQKMAEDALKNMTEEQREEQLPKVKQKIMEKLKKAAEAAAATATQAGPPMPPPPPPSQSPLMKAVMETPGVLGVPQMIGDASIVSRSIAQLQDGILNRHNTGTARDAAERAEMLGAGGMVVPGMITDEFEINDYPTVARQKISHKDPLLQIEEMTGAKVQVKGQHFNPGAKLPEGAKKLYVEIIGPTVIAVQKAKSEVRRMMEALAIRTLNIPGVTRAITGTPGRYDPAVGK